MVPDRGRAFIVLLLIVSLEIIVGTDESSARVSDQHFDALIYSGSQGIGQFLCATELHVVVGSQHGPLAVATLGAVTPDLELSSVLNLLVGDASGLQCSTLQDVYFFWSSNSIIMIHLGSQVSRQIPVSTFVLDPAATIEDVQPVAFNGSSAHLAVLVSAPFGSQHIPVIAAVHAVFRSEDLVKASVFTVSSSQHCLRSSLHTMSQNSTEHIRFAVACDERVYFVQVAQALTPSTPPTALQVATPRFFEIVPTCGLGSTISVHQKGGIHVQGTCASIGWDPQVRGSSHRLHFAGLEQWLVTDSVLSQEELDAGNVTVLGRTADTSTASGILISFISGWDRDWRTTLPQAAPLCLLSNSNGSPSLAAVDLREDRANEFRVQIAVSYAGKAVVDVVSISNSQRFGQAAKPMGWQVGLVAAVRFGATGALSSLLFRNGLLYMGNSGYSSGNATGKVQLSFLCGNDRVLSRSPNGFHCTSCSPGTFTTAESQHLSTCLRCLETGVALPHNAEWLSPGCSWECTPGRSGPGCQYCQNHPVNHVEIFNVSKCITDPASTNLCVEWFVRAQASVEGARPGSSPVDLFFNATVSTDASTVSSLAAQAVFDDIYTTNKRYQSTLTNLVPNTEYVVELSASAGGCTAPGAVRVPMLTEAASLCEINMLSGEVCNGAGLCDQLTGVCNCFARENTDNSVGFMGPACTVVQGLAAQATFNLPHGAFGFDSLQVSRFILQQLMLDEVHNSGNSIGNRIAVRNLQNSFRGGHFGLAIIVNFRQDEIEACSIVSAADGTCFSRLLDIWNSGTSDVSVESNSVELMRHVFKKASNVFNLLVEFGMVELAVSIPGVAQSTYLWAPSVPLQLAQWNALGMKARLEVDNEQRCIELASCDQCLVSYSCGWCSVSQTCVPASSSGPHPYVPSQCPASGLYHRERAGLQTCPRSCFEAKDCDSCAARPECGWCEASSECEHLQTSACATPSYRKTVAQCPRGRCSSIGSATQCLADLSCAWCDESAALCMELETHRCKGRLSTAYTGTAVSCNISAANCQSCTTDQTCAWCPASRDCVPSALLLVEQGIRSCSALSVAKPWTPLLATHEYAPDSIIAQNGTLKTTFSTSVYTVCFPEPAQAGSCSDLVNCGACTADAGCAWCASRSLGHTGTGRCMDSATALHTCPQMPIPSLLYTHACPLTCYDRANSFQSDNGYVTTLLSSSPATIEFGEFYSSSETRQVRPSTTLSVGNADKCVWKIDTSGDPKLATALQSGGHRLHVSIQVDHLIADKDACLHFSTQNRGPADSIFQICPTPEEADCFFGLHTNDTQETVLALSGKTKRVETRFCVHPSRVLSFTTASPMLSIRVASSSSASDSDSLLPIAASLSLQVSTSAIPISDQSAENNDAELLPTLLAVLLASLSTATSVFVLVRTRCRSTASSGGSGGGGGGDGVTQEIMAHLPVFSIPSRAPVAWKKLLFHADSAQCSICFTDAEPGDQQEYRLLSCRHIFHKTCIDQWLSSHTTCPLCRACMAIGSEVKLPRWVLIRGHDSPKRRKRVLAGHTSVPMGGVSQVGLGGVQSGGSNDSSVSQNQVAAPPSTFQYVSPLYSRGARQPPRGTSHEFAQHNE